MNTLKISQSAELDIECKAGMINKQKCLIIIQKDVIIE
jgi:hypothetical protein